MNRPRTVAVSRRVVRPALAGLALVAVLAGCTSTPAAPGRSTAATSAAVSISGTAGATGSTGGTPTAADPSASRPSTGGSGPAVSSVTASGPATGTAVPATTTGASGTGAPATTTGASGTATDPSSYSGGTSAVSTVPSSSLPPAATTEVPAPGSGNIDETVPSVAETTAPSRQLTQTAEFGGKVTAKISAIRAITGVANGPGEIAGPALAITLRVDNGSARSIDLVGVGVTLTDSAGNPTSTLVGPPSSPFTGTLAAGGNASGTYVFTIATDKRRPVTLSLSYSTEAPTVVFSGNAP